MIVTAATPTLGSAERLYASTSCVCLITMRAADLRIVIARAYMERATVVCVSHLSCARRIPYERPSSLSENDGSLLRPIRHSRRFPS